MGCPSLACHPHTTKPSGHSSLLTPTVVRLPGFVLGLRTLSANIIKTDINFCIEKWHNYWQVHTNITENYHSDVNITTWEKHLIFSLRCYVHVVMSLEWTMPKRKLVWLPNMWNKLVDFACKLFCIKSPHNSSHQKSQTIKTLMNKSKGSWTYWLDTSIPAPSTSPRPPPPRFPWTNSRIPPGGGKGKDCETTLSHTKVEHDKDYCLRSITSIQNVGASWIKFPNSDN